VGVSGKEVRDAFSWFRDDDGVCITTILVCKFFPLIQDAQVCFMETPARNETSDTGEKEMVGVLIVTSCGTPKTLIKGALDASHAVTPVTQSSLDPLMHTSTLSGPQGISPSVIETPPAKSYTHVSIFYAAT
jgi:hypothetical protein